MNIVEGIKGWFRNRNRSRSMSSEPLREFVYLDEVSVYSLLASRKRGIATQFTESQTASLNSELGSSLNIGFAALGSKLDEKTQSSQSQASQVIRKATVQTSFKELFDLEKGNLSLTSTHSTTRDQLIIESASDIERNFEALAKDKRIVDITRIKRGDLLEDKVELEADPLFRMTTVITTLYELMGDRDDVFGSVPAGQVREAYAIGQVLERLLAGLVPLRGRIVDYEAIKLGDSEILAHRSLREQLEASYSNIFRPVYVTGVAHHGLFWKDIRQVLFSGSQYSVFCRLATEGLKEDWQPVKVADMFEGVISDFKAAINNFGEIARVTMEGQGKVDAPTQHPDRYPGMELVKEYVELLGAFHQKSVSSDFTETKIIPVVPAINWLSSVVERRAVFDEVTNLVEKELETETPGEIRHSLRENVLSKPNLGVIPADMTSAQGIESTTGVHSERFLDTEIVAIYW